MRSINNISDKRKRPATRQRANKIVWVRILFANWIWHHLKCSMFSIRFVFVFFSNSMANKRVFGNNEQNGRQENGKQAFSVYVPMLMCDIRDISLFIASFSINGKWHQNNRIVGLTIWNFWYFLNESFAVLETSNLIITEYWIQK